MFSKFLNLNPEKQQRIINAACKEFAQKGYDNASTNEMVKEAGISKGLLFHYFNSKKELYLYLYDHLQEMFMEKIYAKIDWNERDIFAKLRQMTLLKFELFIEYPELINYMKSANFEDSNEVKHEVAQRHNKLVVTAYQRFFSDVDQSKFKEDIEINQAINIIFWTLEGFANQQQEKYKKISSDQLNMEAIIAEMETYSETLRNAFYK